MLVAVDKLKDGKEQTVFVNINPAQLGESCLGAGRQDPNAMREKLLHAAIDTELEGVISACKEIGATDGHGGANNADTSSSINATNPAAMTAQVVTKEAELNQKAQQAASKAAQEASGKEQDLKSTQKVGDADSAAEKAKQEQAQKNHDLIWNHNVFWAMLQVAMEGNSSIFGVLTQALGNEANLLEGNQYVTGIITQINNDLQEIVSMPDPSKATPAQKAHEIDVMKDLQTQLLRLQDVINPPAPDAPNGQTEEAKKAREAHNSLGPQLLNQLKQLDDDYTQEIGRFDNQGISSMIAQMEKGNFSPFNKLWNDLTQQDGKSSPGAGPTGIYTQTSSMMTSLNTSGSKYMAQQNLDTKDVDQVEKLWASAMQTQKTMTQGVVGNIAN